MLTRAPERVPSPVPPVAEATRAATIGLALAAIALVACYAALPGARAWLEGEGGLTDLATPVLLVIAAMAAWWGIRHTPGAPGACWLLPAAALLGALDEVHYGTGFLGYHPPQVGPVAIDGFTALLAAGKHLAATQLGLSTLDLAAAAALVAAGAAFLMARERRAPRALAWLADHPPAVHLLAAGVLVLAATGLDLFAVGSIPAFIEEWLEFVAAGLLVRGALLIPRRDPAVSGWRHRLRPWLEGEAPQRALPPAVTRPGL